MNTIYFERSALYYACIEKCIELVQLLLDSGSDPDLLYPDGYALLLVLVLETCQTHSNYTSYINLLLNRGANINIAHSYTGQTALMLAATNSWAAADNIDLVELLLQHGADVTQVNKEGECVLDMLAVDETGPRTKAAELCELYKDSNRVDAKAILK